MYTLKVSIGQDMCYIQKTISNKMAFIVRSVRFGRCGSPVFERDALRQNTKRPPQTRWSFKVGAAGFEPAAPCSQSRCANRTALRPERLILYGGGGGIRTRGTCFQVRRFSKPVVSATHPLHRVICTDLAEIIHTPVEHFQKRGKGK